MDVRGLEYPCRFPVKAFLRPDAAAEEALTARVRALLPEGAPLEVERHLSSGGAYVCLTLSFDARDADHAQRVGAAVRESPGVLLAI